MSFTDRVRPLTYPLTLEKVTNNVEQNAEPTGKSRLQSPIRSAGIRNNGYANGDDEGSEVLAADANLKKGAARLTSEVRSLLQNHVFF